MQGTIQVTVAQLIFAVVGAASFGGIITGLILAASQSRERKSRREELVFSTAVQMAQKRFENAMTILKDTQRSGNLVPEIYIAFKLHRALKSLMDTGTLDRAMQAELAAQGLELD
jgi:hypothetical protein